MLTPNELTKIVIADLSARNSTFRQESQAALPEGNALRNETERLVAWVAYLNTNKDLPADAPLDTTTAALVNHAGAIANIVESTAFKVKPSVPDVNDPAVQIFLKFWQTSVRYYHGLGALMLEWNKPAK